MKRFIEYICEDRESKNMHKARRWIEENHPEVIGQKLDNGTVITPQKLIEEIRNTIPSSRLADCKFLVGVTRLYFDNQRDPDVQRMFGKLNKILKILATAHADEYDENLNGLSFEQLDQKFSGAVQKELSADREDIDKLALIKQSDYEIVPIDSFQEAQKYGKYTSWCVTHQERMYDSYTNGGLGRFYFCLKPGYEKMKAVKGEGCPMDDYGKSMIAVSVNDDGSLNTCTCRWNHDNGGNDNMMDTKEISEFFGVNFYKTFVPYPIERLLEKYSKYRVEDDEISKVLHAMKIKSQDSDDYEYVRISQKNNSIEKFIVIAEDILSDGHQFYHVQNGQLKKGSPQKVSRGFSCSNMNITSLKGSPQEVGEEFDCSNTKLTSLDGAPQKVGGSFYCNSTNITSLKGSPQNVGGSFDCSYTNITSLEGAPQNVGGNFYCYDTKLTSLKGSPQEVGDFYCNGTNITSLYGAPQKVRGNFSCSNTNITSLEGAPQKVGGGFSCSDTKLTSLDGAPQKVGRSFSCMNTKLTQEQIDSYIAFLRHPTPEHIDDTGHYTEKPVVRESLYVQKWADMYRRLFMD